jgi:hypothetical protein
LLLSAEELGKGSGGSWRWWRWRWRVERGRRQWRGWQSGWSGRGAGGAAPAASGRPHGAAAARPTAARVGRQRCVWRPLVNRQEPSCGGTPGGGEKSDTVGQILATLGQILAPLGQKSAPVGQATRHTGDRPRHTGAASGTRGCPSGGHRTTQRPSQWGALWDTLGCSVPSGWSAKPSYLLPCVAFAL